MPSKFEADYVNLIEEVIDFGQYRETRNHATHSLFAKTLVIDELSCGVFPVISGRKMHLAGIVGEFAAFLHGVKTIDDFEKFGCNYWGQWANDDGTIEVDYGNVWRDFNGYDQIANLVQMLKTNPADRRMIVSGWQPNRLAELSLPCCHMLYQWYVNGRKELEMIWYQRSVDLMVGLPSDIVLAALWNILLAQQTGYSPGRITMVLGDTHVYADHVPKALQYCTQAKASHAVAPGYTLYKTASLDNFEPCFFSLTDYSPQQPIKFEVHS